MLRRPRGRDGLIGAIIAAIIVIVIVIALLLLAFVPFRSTPVNESRQVVASSDVTSLELNVTIDVGNVYVLFVDNTSNAVTMDLTGQHRTGLFGSTSKGNVSWTESTSDGTTHVNASITLGGTFERFTSRDINCTLKVSNALRTGLSIANSAGTVNIATAEGTELSSLDVRTAVGGVKLTMVPGSILSGVMNLDSPLGGVDLNWTDAAARKGANISLSTNTGGVRAMIDQGVELGDDLSIRCSTNLGGVDLGMDVFGNNSARVISHASVGGVSVKQQSGFTGNSSELSSTNYRASSNFEVTCGTSVGGVNLALRYSD